MLLAFGFAAVRAGSSSEICLGASLTSENLQISACSSGLGLTRVEYVGSTPPSPYATEFDKRKVVIAQGQDARLVRNAAGIETGPHGASLSRTRLVRPPEEDQLASRKMSRAGSSFEGWTVWVESIQYAAQGAMPGFTMDCATALRTEKVAATAVAECFALEERQRFFSILRTLR